MNAWREILAAAASDCELFEAACRDPGRQQREWLMKLVAANARTSFGSEHGFATLARGLSRRSGHLVSDNSRTKRSSSLACGKGVGLRVRHQPARRGA